MTFTDAIDINWTDCTATARLSVDARAEYLADHFPGAPMLPGLLMLETAVRAATELWKTGGRGAGTIAILEHIDRFHVVRPVVPGETLTVRTALLEPTGTDDTASFTALGTVNGAMAMRARFRLRQVKVSTRG